MITHIFNSSIVSGPEMLVIPALKKLDEPVSIIFLAESRLRAQSEGPIAYAKSFGHQVYSVPVTGRFDRNAFRELRDVLDKINPRIVHAHDVKASLYLHQAKRVRKGFKGILVSTHHGASYRKGKIRLYEEFYVRFILPHFDRVLSVCELDRKSIVRRGVSEKKVSVHLNGTERTLISPRLRDREAVSIRRRWKERNPALPDPEEAIFLGAVARLSPEKRHDRMIKVLKNFNTLRIPGLPDEHKIPVLLFFGVGAEEKRLKQMAKDLGVESQVYFMGYSDTISQEMAGFDLVLCLSDGEGIPMNLLEAGWAGTPVLSTNVGGIPDLISSLQVGYLVERSESDGEIAKKLKDIINHGEGRRTVGTAFQKRVIEHFSEQAWLLRLKQVYLLATEV